MFTKKYDYTEDEYQDALQKIKKDCIRKKRLDEKPKLVFCSGQPASGKSALSKKIIEDYPNIHFNIIDLDKYRIYHPRIKEIERDCADFVQSTNPFSKRIESSLLEYYLNNKMSFIYVGTLFAYEFIKDEIINKAKQQGYDIEIYALAVSNKQSKISAQLREKEQRKTEKFFRRTGEDFIDKADNGFKESIRKLSNSPEISNIKILVRGQTSEDLPVVVYNHAQDSGKSYMGAYQALIDFRQKDLAQITDYEFDR